jgi:hypothetical protein
LIKKEDILEKLTIEIINSRDFFETEYQKIKTKLNQNSLNPIINKIKNIFSRKSEITFEEYARIKAFRLISIAE